MQPKIIFFDCDGVLVTNLLWPNLHKVIGLSDELDRKWWNEYYSGVITNDQWVKNISNFYKKKKLDKKLFEKTLSDIEFNPEAFEIFNYLKEKKILIAIISSGIDFYLKKVAKALRPDYWRANATFHFNNKGLFTHWDYITDDDQTKVIQIEEICAELKIKPTATLFVGDFNNDLKAFKLTQHGILYKGKNPEHSKIAWKSINNLMEIKEILNSDL